MGKLKCRPGDLAVVMRDEEGCESNVGRVVRVRGPVDHDWRGYPTWLITPYRAEGYVWRRAGDPSGVFAYTGEDNIEHPDRWLMPLRKPKGTGKHKQKGLKAPRPQQEQTAETVAHLAVEGVEA